MVITTVSGMIVALMKAMRQSHKKSSRIITTNKAPCHNEPKQIIQRHLDKGRWAEDRRVDVDVGQTRAHLIDGGFHALGHFQAVAPGELFDNQQADQGRR